MSVWCFARWYWLLIESVGGCETFPGETNTIAMMRSPAICGFSNGALSAVTAAVPEAASRVWTHVGPPSGAAASGEATSLGASPPGADSEAPSWIPASGGRG